MLYLGRMKANVKRMHPYQQRRASITRLRLELQKIIETERLVGVVMARFVRLFYPIVYSDRKVRKDSAIFLPLPGK